MCKKRQIPNSLNLFYNKNMLQPTENELKQNKNENERLIMQTLISVRKPNARFIQIQLVDVKPKLFCLLIKYSNLSALLTGI